MSIENERKAFESQNFIKRLLGYSKYDEDRNEYVYFRFEDYAIRDTCELNTAWKAWQASANREGYRLVPVEALECAMGWFGVVENEWTGADDLSNDLKHVDIIQKIIGACDDH